MKMPPLSSPDVPAGIESPLPVVLLRRLLSHHAGWGVIDKLAGSEAVAATVLPNFSDSVALAAPAAANQLEPSESMEQWEMYIFDELV